jgi:hypothetical protein
MIERYERFEALCPASTNPRQWRASREAGTPPWQEKKRVASKK